MSDTVIKVENLSKSAPKGAPHGYPPLGAISHQSGERYTALRDVLTNGIKGMGQRRRRPAILTLIHLGHPLAGAQRRLRYRPIGRG